MCYIVKTTGEGKLQFLEHKLQKSGYNNLEF